MRTWIPWILSVNDLRHGFATTDACAINFYALLLIITNKYIIRKWSQGNIKLKYPSFTCWWSWKLKLNEMIIKKLYWCAPWIFLSFKIFSSKISWKIYLSNFLTFNFQFGQRVPTAASPSNTNSSSSSNTGSQSGTLSTSLSNTNTNNTMGPSSTPLQTEQLSKTNLYIRGLNQTTTDKDLHAMCSQWVLGYMIHFEIALKNSFDVILRYGTIISTKAILDKTTNKCKGENLELQNLRDWLCNWKFLDFSRLWLRWFRLANLCWTSSKRIIG